MTDVQRTLNRLKEHTGDLVLDVETSGLNPHKNHIVAYVITFGPKLEDTVYVPVRCAAGGNISPQPAPQDAIANTKVQPFEHELAKIFRDCTLNIIGHNLMFDLRFMAHHGIVFNNATLSCTQVRQALIDEYTPSFSLDASARHMRVTEKKGDGLYTHLAQLYGVPAERKAMSEYWRLAGDDPIAVDYACGDGVSTWELYGAQAKEIDRQELNKVWKLEQRTTKTLFRMQNRGIRIDVEYMQATRAKLEAECIELRKIFEKWGDEDGFNEMSPKQVEAAMRGHGFKDENFVKTPTGKFSFTEDWLEGNAVGLNVLSIRRKANLVHKFIGPLLDRHLVGDRVYPNYNQLKGDEFGTISGRLSANDPPIQAIPKHHKENSQRLRRGFIPDDGHYWSSRDAKQCEPRIFAEYTKSKFLMDGYMQKPTIDFYNNLDKITNIGRQKCKKLALALFYIAGNSKAAELMGSSIEEATAARAAVKMQLPEIDQFNKAAENNVRLRAKTEGIGYVKDVAGRRARFNDLRFAYKAGNRIIQMGNASYIKHACNEVSDYLEAEKAGDLLLTCHDNLENQVRTGRKDVDDEITKIMVNAAHDDVINFQIPQEMDCGQGVNWAAATFGAEYDE